jgi:hypothetical protein
MQNEKQNRPMRINRKPPTRFVLKLIAFMVFTLPDGIGRRKHCTKRRGRSLGCSAGDHFRAPKKRLSHA